MKTAGWLILPAVNYAFNNTEVIVSKRNLTFKPIFTSILSENRQLRVK